LPIGDRSRAASGIGPIVPRAGLITALEGHLDDHYRFMIGFHLRHLQATEAAIADPDRRI
jgi:hypothetical protein